MGVFRKIFKILISFLFLISFSLLILTISLQKITSYQTLKNITVPLIENQTKISEEQKDLALLFLKEKCKNQREITIEFGTNISIKCDELENLNKDNLKTYIASKIFDSIYFQKYDCDLTKCLKDGKMGYLISADFNSFVSSFLIYIAIATIILGILYFLLIEKLEEKILSFAIIFLLSSAPILFSDYIIPYRTLNIESLEIISQKIKEELNFIYYIFYLGLAFLIVYLALMVKNRFIKKK
ncbi:MAG: hypothetical protein ACP5H3_00425 [Candidatus Aenigmatarchaeota archaeon]|jgi:hypothetical protein